MNYLKDYGLDNRFVGQASMYQPNKLARIIGQYKGHYKIALENEIALASISGKMLYQVQSTMDYPAVGDYVMVEKDVQDDVAIIHHILPRKSIFARKKQIISTNIDTVFICMSLNANYNLNRLERYISIAMESRATPVIILTKSDLCDDVLNKYQEVEVVSMYSDIIVTSIMQEDCDSKLEKYLKPGKTAAFIGSSGVGKSSLINQVLINQTQETLTIDKNEKGRHTTTNREIFVTKYGGVVIDTPGMREIGVENVDLSASFDEIEELAKGCKFSDCNHENEPGCAVIKALENGTLDQRRYDNYIKLRNESSYDGLDAKQIEVQKHERMFKDVGGIKNARKFVNRKR